MHAPLVEVYALERRFGARAALSSVDLVVGPGEVHGLLGPLGAGKSTLLRVLAGSLEKSGGWVRVAERTELVSDDGELSPIEEKLDRGTRARIALARALANAPDVLLIDDSGFDAEHVAATRALVARHAARGGAVVWATRRLDDLQGIASQVTLLAGGRVRYSGSVETLASRALCLAPSPLSRAA
jgi:ABC-2 type transport system ATP-binding protein